MSGPTFLILFGVIVLHDRINRIDEPNTRNG